MLTGLLRRATVEAGQVRSALKRPLAQIVQGVRDLLEQTPAELTSDIVAGGLMLVGGGALLSGFDHVLREETRMAVTLDHDPLTTVARGAGSALDELETLTRSSRR